MNQDDDDIDAILADITGEAAPVAGMQGAHPIGRFARKTFGDTSQQGKTLRRVREKALGDPFHKMASGRTYAEALDSIAQNTNAELTPTANQSSAAGAAYSGSGRTMLNMGSNMLRLGMLANPASGPQGPLHQPGIDAFQQMVNENDESYHLAHPWAHMAGEGATYAGAGYALGPVTAGMGAPAMATDAALGLLGSSGTPMERGLDMATSMGFGALTRGLGHVGGRIWAKARGKPFSEELGALGRWVRDQFHPTKPARPQKLLPPSPTRVGPASGTEMGAGPQFDPNGQGWLPGQAPGVPPEMQVTGGQPPGWPAPAAPRQLTAGQPNVPRTETGAIPVGMPEPHSPDWSMQNTSGPTPPGWPEIPQRIPIPEDMNVPGLLDRGVQHGPTAEPFAPSEGAPNAPQTPTGQSLASALEVGQQRIAQQEGEIAQQLEPFLADVPPELHDAIMSKVRPSIDRVLKAKTPEAYTQAAETLVRNIEKVKASELARSGKTANAPVSDLAGAAPIEGLAGGEGGTQIPINAPEPGASQDLGSLSSEGLGQAYQDALAQGEPKRIAELEHHLGELLQTAGFKPDEISNILAHARGELPPSGEGLATAFDPSGTAPDPNALAQEGLTLRNPGIEKPKRLRSFSALTERLGLGEGKHDIALEAIEAMQRHKILPQIAADLQKVFDAVQNGGALPEKELDSLVTRLQKAFKNPSTKMKSIEKHDPAGWSALRKFADQAMNRLKGAEGGGGTGELTEIGAGRVRTTRRPPPDLYEPAPIRVSDDPNPELTALTSGARPEADWIEAHRTGIATAQEGYKDFPTWDREMGRRTDLTADERTQLWGEMTGKVRAQPREGFHPMSGRGVANAKVERSANRTADADWRGAKSAQDPNYREQWRDSQAQNLTDMLRQRQQTLPADHPSSLVTFSRSTRGDAPPGHVWVDIAMPDGTHQATLLPEAEAPHGKTTVLASKAPQAVRDQLTGISKDEIIRSMGGESAAAAVSPEQAAFNAKMEAAMRADAASRKK